MFNHLCPRLKPNALLGFCLLTGLLLLPQYTVAAEPPFSARAVDSAEAPTPLPRYLTNEEKAYLQRFPLRAPRGTTPPPSGPIFCPPEYAPMEAIMMTYEGPQGWLTILDQMAANITTTGNGDVWVMVDDMNEANRVITNMTNAGANASRINTLIVGNDSIWMRDYGPRFIYEGDVRAIVDHTYNRPRPNDNLIPTRFSEHRDIPRYEIPLVHGGGNYHLHATARAHTTRLINDENPSLTEQEIADLWMDYQNLETSFYEPFPINIDSTQHIDMWMQAIGDDEVIISDWPFDAGSTQDQICDSTATTLEQAGYTVHRIPARSVGGVHYTYTNVVMCNDLVLVPMYTNGQVTQHNNEARTVWENAMPGKTIVQIDCQAIVVAAGVMHCIVMHLPSNRGGVNPNVYIKSRFEGQTLTPGNTIEITWISDDDEGTKDIDIQLSTDSGQTYPIDIVTTDPDDGSYQWVIPDLYAPNARIRITVRDDQNNIGTDQFEQNFFIDGTVPCLPDVFPDLGNGMFGDGVIDENDFMASMSQWRQGAGVYDFVPDNGDGTFGDGKVDILDLLAQRNAFGACPTTD